ncbi:MULTISPECIES: ATP-binding protein [Streptomyces]|uniref:ATP-binding protein n=1 Tax=Streptomyces TaxID=1883 RepID=UPI001F2F2DC3|nr:ATP-binding protein [Streptomyces lycii]
MQKRTESRHVPGQETAPRPQFPPSPEPIGFHGPWEYELRFPRDPRGPGITRTTLRAVLGAHGLGVLADRAELLASEVTTNAVRYAAGPAVVRLRWLHPVLRVSVLDDCAGLPVCPAAGPPDVPGAEAERGRGLLILDLLADSWGDGPPEDTPPVGAVGKSVWFELVLGEEPPPAGVPALAA